METLPRIALSRAEMMKRVARFKDLKGFDGGLPDSKMPGCERTLYNVIGFQPPKGKGGAVTSPVGDDAARLAAIKISEGFNLGYCRAKPGHGPMMHNRPLGLDAPRQRTTLWAGISTVVSILPRISSRHNSTPFDTVGQLFR
jgi:hypothetical protein